MSTLAILGGTPVTSDLLGGARLPRKEALEREYLLDAFDSGAWDSWESENSHAQRFEREFAEFSTSRSCALVTNGTHALQLALEALDIGYGDEVIVPGLTWQATASVVCDVNAIPVLVDIDPETLCMDPAAAERAITPATRAIICVHLFHRMADLDALTRIADAHDLQLIEDCAHVHGARWRDRGAGTHGVMGTYSFQSSKLMNAAEGGAILMQDQDLFLRIASQRICGREVEGVRVHNGNYRITSLQAAVLRGQLAAFSANADTIDLNGRSLDDAVAAAPGVRPFRRDAGLTRMCGYGFGFNYNPAAFDGLDGATFRTALSAETGCGFGSTYEPLNDSPHYYPYTKRRHHLSPEYLRRITPNQYELPAAVAAYRDHAVISSWKLSACPPERAGMLTEAIGRIHDQRKALLDAPAEALAVSSGGAW